MNINSLCEVKEKFQIELENRFAALSISAKSIDELCETVTSTILDTATELAPRRSKADTPITEEDKNIKKWDEERKMLRNKSDRTDDEKVRLAWLHKTVRSKRRRRARKKKTELILRLLEKGKGPKALDRSKAKSKISGMKDKNGVVTHVREEIIEICADFYKDLYSPKVNVERINRENLVIEDVPKIEKDEIIHALKTMKKFKAPGIDMLTSDILLAGGEQVLVKLEDLFNKILEERVIPSCWKEAKIIILHKKGDKQDMKNYRPISLLSHLYKLFTRILQTRLLSILDRYQPREQAGFRKGFSSIDHLHALNNIIAASNEFNLEINVGYIDFEKAFDSVEHEAFLGTLTNIGVNQIYVDILRDIY